MHKIFMVFSSLLFLIACAPLAEKHDPQVSHSTGVNSVSQYCMERGGTFTAQHTDDGQVGNYCHLPDGTIMEAEVLYRQQAQQCQQEQAKVLIGQVLPAKSVLKQQTGAHIVRVVQPHQAVTQDYREERLTVVYDSQTKQILQASCG